MLILDLGNRARKFLSGVPPKHLGQLDRKITELRSVPFLQDSKLLKGYDYYRVDNGEYRIVYRVSGDVLSIPIIGKRNDDEVYKRLKRMEG